MKKLTKVLGILFIIGLLFSCSDGSSSSSSDSTDKTDNTNTEDITIVDGVELTHKGCIYYANILLSTTQTPTENYTFNYNYSTIESKNNNFYFIQFDNNTKYIYNIGLTSKDKNTTVDEILNKYNVTKEEILEEKYCTPKEFLQDAKKNAQYVKNYFENTTEDTKKIVEKNPNIYTMNCLYKIETIDIDNATLTLDFSNVVLGYYTKNEEDNPGISLSYNTILFDITFTPNKENSNFYENSVISKNGTYIQNAICMSNHYFYIKQNYEK